MKIDSKEHSYKPEKSFKSNVSVKPEPKEPFSKSFISYKI